MDAVVVALSALIVAGYSIVLMWTFAECRLEWDGKKRMRWLRICVLVPFVGRLIYFGRRVPPEPRHAVYPTPIECTIGTAASWIRRRAR